jgi:SNF2 family DNA or RNA helicase
VLGCGKLAADSFEFHSVATAKEITVVENCAHPLQKHKSRSCPYKFIIVSFNLLTKLSSLLEHVSFNMVIVDECHYMKNPQAARTKWLIPLIQKSKRAILISGTPALSRPMELFTQLHSLAPKNWPDEKEFGRRYCKTEKVSNNIVIGGSGKGKGKWGDFKGSCNTKELHLLLTGTLMIRRLKKDVLSQLPQKCRKVNSIYYLFIFYFRIFPFALDYKSYCTRS